MKKSFVLDTNIFFNLELNLGLGKAPNDIFQSCTKAMKAAPEKLVIIISPAVAEEILSFESCESETVREFLQCCTIKSPALDSLSVGARVVALLAQNYRDGNQEGSRIAIQALEELASLLSTSSLDSRKDVQIAVGPVVKKFREKYRIATRHNQLDSVADVETLCLCLETGASLVSSDEGLIRIGREMGVHECLGKLFADFVQELISEK